MDAQTVGIPAGAIAVSQVLAQILGRFIDARLKNGRGDPVATVGNLQPFHDRMIEMLGSLLSHLEAINVNQREMATLIKERSRQIVQASDDVAKLKAILTDRERQDIHNRLDDLSRLVGELRKERAA